VNVRLCVSISEMGSEVCLCRECDGHVMKGLAFSLFATSKAESPRCLASCDDFIYVSERTYTLQESAVINKMWLRSRDSRRRIGVLPGSAMFDIPMIRVRPGENKHPSRSRSYDPYQELETHRRFCKSLFSSTYLCALSEVYTRRCRPHILYLS